MGAVHIHPRPALYPGRTPLLGSTQGPVAFMGELLDGFHVYLTKREVKEAVIAFGLPTEEQHAELEEHAHALAERVKALEDGMEVLRGLRMNAVEDVLQRMEQRFAPDKITV